MSWLKKLASPSSLMIVIPVAIFLFLLISNIGPILDKLGLETRASLKAELVKVKKNLDLAKEHIKQLETEAKKDKLICNLKEDLTDKFKDKNDVVDQIIKDINIQEYINKKKKEETSEGVREDSPPEEIISIHRVYNALYGAT